MQSLLHNRYWNAITPFVLPLFVFFSILWKGGKSLESTWLLVAVAWMTILLFYNRKPKYVRADPIYWPAIILFILWTAVSLIESSTKNYGLDELFRAGALGLLFLWSIRIAKDENYKKERLYILKSIALAALCACVIGIAVYVFQPVNRFVGTFFDARFHTDYWPNAWAQFLLLAWPVLTYFVLFSPKKVHRFIRLLILSFFAACLALSYSRGAMIAFAGQLVLTAVLMYQRGMISTRFQSILTSSVVVILGAFLFFHGINNARQSFYDVQSVSDKVTFTADEGTSSASERRQFWNQAYTLSLERPYVGWGPYSFRFIQPRLQEGIFQTSDHPHNVFLKLAMERGWPAAILFIIIVVSFLWTGIRSGLQSTDWGLAQFAFVSVAGVLAHNLIDYNLQFVGIALPFWFLMGYTIGRSPLEKGYNMNKKLVRTVEILLITFLLCFATWEAVYLVESSIGRHEEAKGNTDAALEWYSNAEDQKFSRDMHLSRTNIHFDKRQLTDARTALEAYFAQNNEDARAWKSRGDIAFAEDRLEDAIQSYAKAYRSARFNDLSITSRYIRALQEGGRQNEIDTRRNEFDSLMNDYSLAILQNAHFIALGPNVEELISLANMFAAMYPESAPLYEVMAAKVDNHSSFERERLASRPPGYLW